MCPAACCESSRSVTNPGKTRLCASFGLGSIRVLPGALQACAALQGFETIYRRFDSTPGNTISIQGQVHVAVRTLLAKYGDDKKKGAITSITTAGAASSSY